MAKILSIEEYYNNKLVQEVMAIRVKFKVENDILENRNKKLQMEIEALTSENEALKAIIKTYEKEKIRRSHS